MSDDGYLEDWSREGFTGDKAWIRRAHYAPDYLSAAGPHAPKRLNVSDLQPANAGNPLGMPIVIAGTKTGVRLSVARRTESMPYIMRNVECDEMHFVQHGNVRVRTGYGTFDAGPGDFVCIPRSVAYQILLQQNSALMFVVESPAAIRLRPADGPGTVDPLRDVAYPELETMPGPARATTLILKSIDDITEFVLPDDPLHAIERGGGINPVWKVRLADVKPKSEGHPVPFLGTSGNDLLMFSLNASERAHRPPVHVNADYDEVIYFFAGPGAWGGVNEPGTLTWVPKGVTHNGPSENVPEGYLAWLLESRATLRLTPAGLAIAELMETGLYGRHRGAVTAS
jgi:homogentisate 1,2-dioxygenase